MDLQEIKNIQLNEEDFKLLNESIELLMQKCDKMQGDGFEKYLNDFTKMMPPSLGDDLRSGIMKIHRQETLGADLKKESLQLLLAKLIRLKRLLTEADIMDQVKSSFTPPPKLLKNRFFTNKAA